MPNEIRNEIHGLLEDEKSISTRTGMRLTLSMLIEMDDKITELVGKKIPAIEGRIGKLETESQDLQKKNIINWIQKNPKSAIVAFFSFILFVDILVDKISSSFALTTLYAFFKKILGLP